jgi:hypothetical protein
MRLIFLTVFSLLVACGEAAPSAEPTDEPTSAPTENTEPIATSFPLPPAVPLDIEQAELLSALRQLEPEYGEYEAVQKSSTGGWTATVSSRLGIQYEGQEYVQHRIVIAATDGSTVYHFEQAGFYGLGYSTPDVVWWTLDGKGLFIANRAVADGAGLYYFYSSLVYLDLATGALTPRAETLNGELSFAPNEEHLAYISFNFENATQTTREAFLYLLSFADNITEVGRLQTDCPEQVGGFVWSPDETQVAFTAVVGDCAGEDGTQIYIAGTDPFSLRVVHEGEGLYTVGWYADGIMLEDDEHAFWTLDPETSELQPAAQ